MKAIRCPGCGDTLQASNETVLHLRAKRHAKKCVALHDLAKKTLGVTVKPGGPK